MSIISFTGIPDSYPIPSTLVQINFAQGQVSSGTNTYAALLLGNKSSAGSAGVDGYLYGIDTSIPLQTVQDAITLFGPGSELHIMYRDFVLRNPLTPVYVSPIKVSTGSPAVLVLTIAGAVTAAGTLRIFTPEGPIDTGFSVGDTLTNICSNAAINLNGNQNLPFTAVSGSGTITLTAKCAGLRGNQLRSGMIVVGTGTGITVSIPAAGFMSYFAGGTTSDSNANVITYLESLGRTFYYVASAANDVTQFPALDQMVQLQALPATGIRQRCFCGSNDALATVETLSTDVNDPRAEILWMQNSDWSPSRLAAVAASAYSAQEAALGGPSSVNFNFFGATPTTAPLWGVPAPLDGTSPSQSARVSALNSGVTPIVPVAGIRTEILRRVTTYFYQGSASTPDYRVRDASQVTICDFFANDVASAATLQFTGMVINNDPPTGTSGLPNTLTPRVYRSLILNKINEYAQRGLLQNVAQTISDMVVLRETSPSTRISAQVPLQPIEILNQLGLVVNQTTASQ